MNELSVLLITKNAEDVITKCLNSVHLLAKEIIVIDDSTDQTKDIAKKFNCKIYTYSSYDLGKKRYYGLSKVTTNWVLCLDADEVVSKALFHEIKNLLTKSRILVNGYLIPYQNHFLNRPIKYGGENYNVMRLFRKSKTKVAPAFLHEQFIVKGKLGVCKNKIYHYSYRSILQVYRKFTGYALRGAKQKVTANEKTSLKKITLYPIHMFWARFIKDKGYKDGIFRIPLDLGFAYMEFLMYFSMIFIKRGNKE